MSSKFTVEKKKEERIDFFITPPEILALQLLSSVKRMDDMLIELQASCTDILLPRALLVAALLVTKLYMSSVSFK